MGVYHTRDSYHIKLLQPLLKNRIEVLSKALEEHDLIADYYHCLNAMQDQDIVFTARSTYKLYKRFLAMLYYVCGPFLATISFDEDYPPAGCAYNTTVNVEIDDRGNYLMSLLNVLSFTKDLGLSRECQRRRVEHAAPFEPNSTSEGQVASWFWREGSRRGP